LINFKAVTCLNKCLDDPALKGMFEISDCQLPENVKTKSDIGEDSEFNSTLRSFMNNKDLVIGEVDLNGQKYKSGDVIVIKAFDRDNLLVGVIQTILVKENGIYFVVIRYNAKRNKLGYFVTDSQVQKSFFQNASCLADYKPLIMHGTLTKFKFALHHYISISHSSDLS
jgi:hypothetical protein